MRRGPQSSFLAAAVVVALAFLGNFASAYPADDLARQIAADNFDAAAETIADESAIAALRSSSSGLRDAATAAADRAWNQRPSAAAEKVVDFLVREALAATAARADDRRAWRALAEAKVARARASFARGETQAAEVWFSAADAYERAAAPDDPGDGARVRCVGRIVAGAATAGAQSASVVGRGTGIAKKALGTPGVAADVRMAYGRALFDAARQTLASDRKTAREAARAAFDAIRPLRAGEKTEVAHAMLWNDTVTFDRANKFGLDESYATRRIPWFADGLYTVDLPISRDWILDGALIVHRARSEDDREGEVVAAFGCHAYSFSAVYRYAAEKIEISGDNPKALAAYIYAADYRSLFKKVTQTREPKKMKLGTDVNGYLMEVIGEDADGNPFRVRDWVFRGAGQKSHEVRMADSSRTSDLDPEAQALLESIREAPKHDK